MKISAITVDSFKRIDHVELAPDADKVLVLIGGRNAQGKSSLLDALTAAFGGKNALPADPIRHGAEAAEIRVELDGGALVVKRIIKADGESVLEVRDADGKLRSPQAALDKLIGARFLDPLAFLSMSPPEQRKALLAIIDRDGKIAKLDERRARVFDRRTEVGRDHRKATAELERLPEIKPPDEVDVGALRQQQQALDAEFRARMDAKHQRSAAAAAVEAHQGKVDRLERQLAEIAAELEATEQHLAAAKETLARADAAVAALPPSDIEDRRSRLNEAFDEASKRNAQAAGDRERARRRAEVAAEIDRLAGGIKTLADELEKIDAEKAHHLTASPLPVKGLDVDADGIKFNGVPFDQASGAEQLRVALALAIAASPNLHDVWVRDGALLDDEALAALAREAEAAGRRLWLERVGDRDPGAIIIENGRVRGAETKVAKSA